MAPRLLEGEQWQQIQRVSYIDRITDPTKDVTQGVGMRRRWATANTALGRRGFRPRERERARVSPGSLREAGNNRLLLLNPNSVCLQHI